MKTVKLQMKRVYTRADEARAAFDDGKDEVSYIGIPGELWIKLGRPNKVTVTVVAEQ